MLPELKTFLIAMSPLIELRGAIPVALGAYKLPFWSAYLFSVLGNLVPMVAILLLLDPAARFFSDRSLLFKEFFSWLFQHSRTAGQTKTEKWGKSLAVLILVATPIPFIGGWTGAILAAVLGMPIKKALPLVVLGTLISGAVVGLLSSEMLKLFC